MALWQFKLWFVPAKFVKDRKSLTEQECEDEAWGNMKQPSENFLARISIIFPPHKSWHKQLLQWGEQDGDLMEVWMNGDKVRSIGARIDCRNLNGKIMRQIFDLAHEWGFRLVYQRYRTVLPDVWEDFVRAVCDSPNLKFMQAPEELLPKLAKEIGEQR